MKTSISFFLMAFLISAFCCSCRGGKDGNNKDTKPHSNSRDFKITAYLEVNDGTNTKVYQVEDRRNDPVLSSLNKDGNRYSSFGLTDAKRKEGQAVNLQGGLTINKDDKGEANIVTLYLDDNALLLAPIKPLTGTHSVSNIRLYPFKVMDNLAHVSFRYEFKDMLMEDNIQKGKSMAEKDNSKNYQYKVSGYFLCEPNN